MGIVGIIFCVIAAIIALVSLCISLFVCICYKNAQVTLAFGLISVALVLGIAIVAQSAGRSIDNSKPIPSTTGNLAVNVTTSTPAILNSSIQKPNSTSQTPMNTPSQTDKPAFAPQVTNTAPPVVTPSGVPNGSTIYLTFDDGPSEDDTTNLVLDELAKYNVKATFFIVNFRDADVPVLKRMVAEGHTLGIHGYSHVYSEIYASPEAAKANITKLRDKVREKVGYDATVIRFPGGSSNNSSKQYCVGVMTELVKWSNEQGFTYVDWNVDPSDALTKLTPDEVSSRLKKDISAGRKANVILLHDFEGQTGTLGALDDIIEWGIANGYSFDRLTKDSPKCQHQVNN